MRPTPPSSAQLRRNSGGDPADRAGGLCQMLRNLRPGAFRHHRADSRRFRHVGKIPSTSRTAVQLEGRISELKTRLAKAVADQNFEQAAALRDQIRDLEAQNQQDQQGKEKAE